MNFQTKEAFKRVFDEYYNPLCNFSSAILNNDTLAEDTVQEVFLHIWNKRKDIHIQDDIRNYLFSAVKNKSLEVLRKKKAEVIKISAAGDNLIEGKSYNIVEESSKYMRLERLYNSLRHLPPKCREIFEMSKLEGLTYSEIAKHLNLSVKTVETQISRALKILRKNLK